MKSLIRLILVPIIAILLVVIAFILLPSGIRSSIFARIPLVNQFVQTTTQTRLAGITTKQVSEFEMARFSVDFLLQLENESGHYIAIYPFTVTAGFNDSLTTAELSPTDRINEAEKTNSQVNNDKSDKSYLVVTLPKANILSTGITDDHVLIIRDTMEDGNWNGYISPVVNAFKQKACDYAIENGIFDRSYENIKQYINNLFSDSDVEIVYRYVDEVNTADSSQRQNSSQLPEKGLVNIESTYLPVTFKMKAEQFSTESLDYLSRDDTLFNTGDSIIRTGLATAGFWRKGINEWFKYETEKAIEDGRTILLYRDPFNPLSKGVISYADTFYRDTRILLGDTDGTLIYVQSLIPNDQIQQDTVAQEALYIAMSSIPSTKTKKHGGTYRNFSSIYDNVPTLLEKGSFAILSNYSTTLKSLNEATGYTTENPDIRILDAAIALLYHNEKQETGFSELDNWVEIAQIIQNNDYSKMDKDFRQKALSILDIIPASRLNLESYFLKNSGNLFLDLDEKTSFIDDIVQNGDVINRDLFSSLDPNTRKQYLSKILTTKITDFTISTDKNDIFILTGDSNRDIFNKKNRGPDFIRNRLGQEANQNTVYLIFSEKHLLGNNYQALVFGIDSLYLYDNITSILGTKVIVVPYSEVSTYGDGFFTIKNKSYEDKQIQAILTELQQIYMNDDTYALKITENIESYLRAYVDSVMKRP